MSTDNDDLNSGQDDDFDAAFAAANANLRGLSDGDETGGTDDDNDDHSGDDDEAPAKEAAAAADNSAAGGESVDVDWQALPEPVRKRLADLESESSKWKNAAAAQNGRVSALTKKVDELSKHVATPARTVQGATDADDTGEDADLDALTQDFPALEKLVSREVDRRTAPLVKTAEQIERERQRAEEEALAEKAAAGIRLITEKHPDFGQIRDSRDFQDWLGKQPKGDQFKALESDDPQDAVDVIDKFKAATRRPAASHKPRTEAYDDLPSPRVLRQSKGSEDGDGDDFAALVERKATRLRAQQHR